MRSPHKRLPRGERPQARRSNRQRLFDKFVSRAIRCLLPFGRAGHLAFGAGGGNRTRDIQLGKVLDVSLFLFSFHLLVNPFRVLLGIFSGLGAALVRGTPCGFVDDTCRHRFGHVVDQGTARLLGIDQKTLRGHVRAGNIRFVTIGLGVTKLRREFTLIDILEFLERMRRRECPSTSAPTRPTTIMTSSGDILGFTARRAKLIAERRKHSNAPKRNA
jgi:hypothetical protein